MNAIIWRESVYKNNFRCCTCGTVLAENGQPTDNAGFNADTSQRQDILYCCKCKTPVAVLKYYKGDLPPGTMAGRWEGGL